MSLTDSEVHVPAAAEQQLLVRTFTAEVAESGDGRTLEGLVVPYGVAATVADPPDFLPYREEIMAGAFRGATKAPNRVLLDFEHYGATNDAVGSMGSIAGTLGHAVALEERADGLHGQFRVLRGSDGDKVLELAQANVLGGFSAAFRPLRSLRAPDGTMQRLRAHLDRVSLCRVGAYPQAAVLAIRSGVVRDQKDEPKPADPELLRTLALLGVELPEALNGLLRAFTEMPWDGSASRWPDAAAYCAACAIDLNEAGGPKTKDACHLPFKEPGTGDVNVNAVRAALSRLGQGDPQDATAAERESARAMLERLLAEFNG